MRYAIISDVHGNATALRRVLADAAAQGVEEIVCLGDTLGYGPEPAKALRMVRESCTIVLAGNHDDAVAGRVDAGDFIDLAQDAALRHREELTGEDIDYLKALPYTCRGDGFAAVHGDFTDPRAFNYVDCESVAAGNFAAMSEQLMFVGHTHEPRLALMGSSGTVYMTGPQDFSLEEGKRYIVNPGSVGYPRAADGKCMSSYVIFDSSGRSVFFRFIPFTVDSMLQRGRPHRFRRWAAISAGLLAGVLASALCFLPAAKTASSVESNELMSETLDLAGEGKVAANLVLGRNSPGVELRLEFYAPDGSILQLESQTVKRSSRKMFPVPRNAVAAKFVLVKIRSEDRPVIEKFAPDLSVAGRSR